MAGNLPDQELSRVLARTEEASRAWMTGDWAPFAALVSHAEDFSIFGPFGGPASTGYERWAEVAPRVAAAFREGDASLRLIQHYRSPDLLVLVLEEEQRGTIGGTDGQAWSLRVTQVYRREAGEWRVVHRHADPLVRPRNLDEAKEMARG